MLLTEDGVCYNKYKMKKFFVKTLYGTKGGETHFEI